MLQLEMHLLLPGLTAPDAPVSAGDSIQKSSVITQLPQTLQHTLRGHGFRSASLVPSVRLSVPGTAGPQVAPVIGLGISGSPSLRQMLMPGWTASQPV